MAEHDIRALGAAFDRLIHVLDHQTRELRPLLASLERLPEMMANAQLATQSGFADLQSILIQVRIYDISADLTANQALAELEKQQLQGKTEKLKADLEAVAERYRRLIDQISRETEQHIRELDQPVLDLLETLYPNTVEARFREQLFLPRSAIQKQLEQTTSGRENALYSALGDLRKVIEEFKSRRAAASKTLDGYSRPTSAPHSHEVLVPVLVKSDLNSTYTIQPLGKKEAEASGLQQWLSSAIQRGRLKLETVADNEGLKELRATLERSASSERKIMRRWSAARLYRAIGRRRLRAVCASLT